LVKPASFDALVKMVEGFGIPNDGRWELMTVFTQELFRD